MASTLTSMAERQATADSSDSDWTIRVPKVKERRKYALLKFNGSLGVDVGNWASDGSYIQMQREDNRAVYDEPRLHQEYGADTEYGKAAREVVRRKKMGLETKSYKHDDQPWLIKLGYSAKTTSKNYRGTKDSGMGEHSDYWIFIKGGSSIFDAYKVENRYQFLPVAKHKTLNIDEAEEQFQKRSAILNQFALKASLKEEEEDAPQQDQLAGTSKKASKSLKISDRDDYPSDSGGEEETGKAEKDDDSQDQSSKKTSKTQRQTGAKRGKNRKGPKKTKRKGEDEDDEDTVAATIEDEDGQEEGQEVDYISDSGSDSEPEPDLDESAVDKQMVGVESEKGLRQLMVSDDEDEDEEDELEGSLLKDAANFERVDGAGNSNEADVAGDSDSGSSDSDDPDSQNFQSALFLQRKPTSASASSSVNVRNGNNRSAPKRAAGAASAAEPATKLRKVESNEGITEIEVRKYLQRRPHSVKDLLGKFKPKCKNMSKEQLVTKLAEILKRIDPDKKKMKGHLYFSLNFNTD